MKEERKKKEERRTKKEERRTKKEGRRKKKEERRKKKEERTCLVSLLACLLSLVLSCLLSRVSCLVLSLVSCLVSCLNENREKKSQTETREGNKQCFGTSCCPPGITPTQWYQRCTDMRRAMPRETASDWDEEYPTGHNHT